jgi:hypothetical protein
LFLVLVVVLELDLKGSGGKGIAGVGQEVLIGVQRT